MCAAKMSNLSSSSSSGFFSVEPPSDVFFQALNIPKLVFGWGGGHLSSYLSPRVPRRLLASRIRPPPTQIPDSAYDDDAVFVAKNRCPGE